MLKPEPIDEADMALSWTRLPPGPELAIHLSLIEWETLPDRELVAAIDAARRQATTAGRILIGGSAVRRRST
jgi:hypothetical protein